MAFRIPAALRSRIIKAAAGGALSIAAAMLGGHQGLEGQENTPYRDVVGVLTVCSGITGPDVIPGKFYTDHECDLLLTKHLSGTAANVDRYIQIPVPASTRAALYSFAYNVGAANFKTSTLLRLLNLGKRQEACEQLGRWVYAGGKRFDGLVNRREIEKAVCLADDIPQL